MRISDWSSDVCSSDLVVGNVRQDAAIAIAELRSAVNQRMSDAADAAEHEARPHSHREFCRGRLQTFRMLCPPPHRAAVNGPAQRTFLDSPAASKSRCDRWEARREGKEGVSKCRSRGVPY